MPETMKIEDIRSSLKELSTGTPTLQEFGENSVMIKIPGKDLDTEGQKAIYAEVQSHLGDKVEFRRNEYVGPQVGSELIIAGVKAFVYSMLGIMAYIWMRFEWQFGVTGIVALVHDMCAIMLFFLITQYEFDLSTVAAALLVAGYSINETVIIFDRIREMMRKYRKAPMNEIINMALNDTLSRTVMTTLSTFMAMASLAYYGSAAIQGFSYAMLIGIFFGPYSSMFISGPLLLYLNPRPEQQSASMQNGQSEAHQS